MLLICNKCKNGNYSYIDDINTIPIGKARMRCDNCGAVTTMGEFGRIHVIKDYYRKLIWPIKRWIIFPVKYLGFIGALKNIVESIREKANE